MPTLPDRRVALVDERRRERDRHALAVCVEDLGAQPLDAPAARADEAHDVARDALGVERRARCGR